ncbi:MAG: hypothetical protein AAGC63_13870 [Propionicimonas sp.]
MAANTNPTGSSSGRWHAAGARIRSAARPLSVKIGASLVVVGLLAAGAQASGADFNDLVQVGVDAKAGSLDINVDGEQGNPTPVTRALPLDKMKPGDATSITLDVRNTGSLPAVVTASVIGLGPTNLGAQLDATLVAAPAGAAQVTGTAKANGFKLAPFTVPANGSVPLTVTLTFPSASGNEWQAKEDKLTLTLDAVQE